MSTEPTVVTTRYTWTCPACGHENEVTDCGDLDALSRGRTADAQCDGCNSRVLLEYPC